MRDVESVEATMTVRQVVDNVGAMRGGYDDLVAMAREQGANIILLEEGDGFWGHMLEAEEAHSDRSTAQLVLSAIVLAGLWFAVTWVFTNISG